MVDILGFEVPLPEGISIGSNTWVILGFVFVLFIIGMISIYFIYIWKTYSKKIIVFENIAGQGYSMSYKDRARTIKIGDQGEELLYLLKKKVYRTAYGKKMGKNTYWFAVGQDGYWYNIVLGDIDAKKGMLDIEPIDRDMRYMHVAIRKNIQDRYRKVKFMDKYGSWIIGGSIVFICLLGLYFVTDKIADVASNTAVNIETGIAVNEAAAQILTSLDNIISRVCGGGGIETT